MNAEVFGSEGGPLCLPEDVIRDIRPQLVQDIREGQTRSLMVLLEALGCEGATLYLHIVQ